MDKLHLLNVFVAVVDANGFVGAARKLQISPPAVTRAINELEVHLGVSLLTRTTRVVRVTEAGARYFEDCRLILAQLAEADESVGGRHATPRGRLTVTAPVLFGAKYVMPIVSDYLLHYPEMTAACWFLDRVVNLLEEGVDVGVRIGELQDSSMHAIHVGEMPTLICASPAYLDEHGIPETPEDLAQHTTIGGTGGAARVSTWHFQRDGLPLAVKLRSRLHTNSDAAVAAALNGFGLASVLSYKVDQYLREGRLKEVLTDYAPIGQPVHLVHREGQLIGKKTRAFVDIAVQRLRAVLETAN